MEFRDFKPEELLGKKVLFEVGSSTMGTSKRITKIIKVTKTSFKIEESENLFDLTNGQARGMSGRLFMTSISYCKLISDDDEKKLIKKWAEAREKKSIHEEISKIDYKSLSLSNYIKRIESIIKL